MLDVKRDGKLDVVTANETSDSLTFAYGDGAGGFTGILNQTVGTGPYAVTVADFDRNGFDDVAVANRAAGTVQAVTLTLPGTPTVKNPVSVATFPNALAAGDFNRDGLPDLVSTSGPTGTVEFLRGNGDGTFNASAAANRVVVAGTPQDIEAGDFNRDGFLDVAVLSQDPSVNVHLVFGDGAGG